MNWTNSRGSFTGEQAKNLAHQAVADWTWRGYSPQVKLQQCDLEASPDNLRSKACAERKTHPGQGVPPSGDQLTWLANDRCVGEQGVCSAGGVAGRGGQLLL